MYATSKLKKEGINYIIDNLFFDRSRIRWDLKTKLIVYFKPILKLLLKIKCFKLKNTDLHKRIRQYDTALKKFRND